MKLGEFTIASAALTGLLLAAGCGDAPQGSAGVRKSDAKPWEPSQNAYVAEGWKAGDQASWEQQLRQRAQNQNEYARAPAKSQ